MNNNFNNYPYGYNTYGPQMKIPIVNGKEGAETFRIGPDSNVILMDNSGKMIWVVSTDSAGYRSVQGYDLSLHTEPAPPDFNLLMTRMSKMEELLNGLVSARNNTEQSTQSTIGNGIATSSAVSTAATTGISSLAKQL